MRYKQIFFSALVSAGIGAVFGLAVTQIAPSPYQSKTYSTLNRNYPLFGAIAGFFGGGILSAVQQLNEQYDRQDH
jgi:hypothetical protein